MCSSCELSVQNLYVYQTLVTAAVRVPIVCLFVKMFPQRRRSLVSISYVAQPPAGCVQCAAHTYICLLYSFPWPMGFRTTTSRITMPGPSMLL